MDTSPDPKSSFSLDIRQKISSVDNTEDQNSLAVYETEESDNNNVRFHYNPENGIDLSERNEKTSSKENDELNPALPSSQTSPPSSFSCKKALLDFYWMNEFLILGVIAIALAKAYPPLGAEYLVPKITSTWIAVILIFFLSGLSLKTSEFKLAFQRVWFNFVVEFYSFGVASGFGFILATFLERVGLLNKDLASGMIICSCLPMTVNMVMVLTAASGGDEAMAVFHAAFGNMIGVFLSPMLILLYLREESSIDILQVFFELTMRVVVPVILGQVVQKTSTAVVKLVQSHKFCFKQIQQYLLVYIVYTVFCRTFKKKSENPIGSIFLMILFQFILLVILMTLAWFVVLKFLFPRNPKLRVMGLFGCCNKSVATGIPLIEAIYSSSPSVGIYTLPILIWHPMQLVIGTFLSPYLARFVASEQKRLGLDENDQPIEGTISNNSSHNVSSHAESVCGNEVDGNIDSLRQNSGEDILVDIAADDDNDDDDPESVLKN